MADCYRNGDRVESFGAKEATRQQRGPNPNGANVIVKLGRIIVPSGDQSWKSDSSRASSDSGWSDTFEEVLPQPARGTGAARQHNVPPEQDLSHRDRGLCGAQDSGSRQTQAPQSSQSDMAATQQRPAPVHQVRNICELAFDPRLIPEALFFSDKSDSLDWKTFRAGMLKFVTERRLVDYVKSYYLGHMLGGEPSHFFEKTRQLHPKYNFLDLVEVLDGRYGQESGAQPRSELEAEVKTLRRELAEAKTEAHYNLDDANYWKKLVYAFDHDMTKYKKLASEDSSRFKQLQNELKREREFSSDLETKLSYGPNLE